MAHGFASSKSLRPGKSRDSDCRSSGVNPAGWEQPLLLRQWKYLWPHESVELRRGSELIGTGWIDDVTPDATTLWVQLSEGRGRLMVHQADGIDIWRLTL